MRAFTMPRRSAVLLALGLTALAVPGRAQSASPAPDAVPSPDEARELTDDPANEDEPPLPSGLDSFPDEDEPALPSGLGGVDEGDEPALPNGLETTAPADDGSAAAPEPARLPLEWSLFLEARAGARVKSDPYEHQTSIAELRAHIDITQAFRPWSTSFRLVLDGVADALADEDAPDLETGEGALDLRAASVTFSPVDWLDARLGRQILTWGTGDLVFINDLFPKDWVAFLIGRDVDYLKAPSDAAKLSFFTPLFDIDAVLTPVFDADRLPRRDRLSSYDPRLGRIAGEDAPVSVTRPDHLVRDGEFAMRVHRVAGPWEISAYGYRGFWKSPAGFDPTTASATFPALAVYGASVRGPFLGGIANAELGYYDSLDDRQGTDPLVRNSEIRALAGYELNLGRYVTTGAQYYLESMRHFERHDDSVGGALENPERHVITTRLTVRALAERLGMSLFLFASPSDVDGYLRADVSYAASDHWKVSAGANLFAGRDDYTFFGQLRQNSNVYWAARFAM